MLRVTQVGTRRNEEIRDRKRKSRGSSHTLSLSFFRRAFPTQNRSLRIKEFLSFNRRRTLGLIPNSGWLSLELLNPHSKLERLLISFSPSPLPVSPLQQKMILKDSASNKVPRGDGRLLLFRSEPALFSDVYAYSYSEVFEPGDGDRDVETPTTSANHQEMQCNKTFHDERSILPLPPSYAWSMILRVLMGREYTSDVFLCRSRVRARSTC